MNFPSSVACNAGAVSQTVEMPSYDELAMAQVDEVLKERGKGDLNALLNSGMTWTVGADGVRH